MSSSPASSPLFVYVMPLWRYLAGDAPGAARAGAATGDPQRRAIQPTRAKLFVRHLRRGFHGLTRGAGRWRDEGEAVFALPFDVDAWRGLQAFAADQQYPLPTFHFGRHADRHRGLRAVWDGAHSAYVHLIKHHANRGFYLPIDFARPIEIATGRGGDDDEDDGDATVIAGSSVRLLRELNLLGPRIGMDRDLGELADAGEPFALRSEPLARVKYGWAFMRHVTRLSVQHRLPIIFDG